LSGAGGGGGGSSVRTPGSSEGDPKITCDRTSSSDTRLEAKVTREHEVTMPPWTNTGSKSVLQKDESENLCALSGRSEVVAGFQTFEHPDTLSRVFTTSAESHMTLYSSINYTRFVHLSEL
jgi:hypothetical protein